MTTEPDDARLAERLQADTLVHAGETVLRLRGQLDLSVVAVLRRAVDRIEHHAPGPLLIDLTGLHFIDAAGLHALCVVGAELGERLRVRPGRHRRLFAIVGYDKRLRLVDDGSDDLSGRLEVAAANLAYVRRLYDAWRTGGVTALVGLVQEGVEWKPSHPTGTVLHGSGELLEHWCQTPDAPVTGPAWFTAVEHDVLVETEHVQPDGRRRRVHSLYAFDGFRLVRAMAVPHAPDVPF